jgi:A/G-specific adenine glycosylase
MTKKQIKQFQKIVFDFYEHHGRHDLPWRTKITPYRVYVSEIMLQQTQVDRVIHFFHNWIKLFPSWKALALAPQDTILRAWKGLGYNSRALRMKQVAEIVTNNYTGKLPRDKKSLESLPGIGPYTAGAICAFAYQQPVTMIETNIRRVFIHHFFQTKNNVHDKDIFEFIHQTLPENDARRWYWALMDYGAHLGKHIPNPNKKSRHYTVQKKFKGSDREIRGKILEILLEKKNVTIKILFDSLKELSRDTDRIEIIIDQLMCEGFLVVNKNTLSLKK